MNTELLGGVLVARMLEGMRFALGCAVAARKSVLDSMGGFEYLQEFLAEDFVMGNRAAEMGHRLLFSSYLIEHRIGSQPLMKHLKHRLPWSPTPRRSPPPAHLPHLSPHPLPRT